MGIITGYVSLVLLILLLLYGLLIRFKKTKKVFSTIHKPITYILLVISIIHFILVLPVLKQRNTIVYVSGIIMIALLFAIIIFWHFTKKKKLSHIIISCIIFVFLIIHMTFYFVDFSNYQRKIKEIEMTDIDVSTLNDGNYYGEYDAGYIYAKVKVIIENKQITNIEIIEHQTEKGKKAESIIDDIKKNQALDVNVVTGATNSSMVIKKALENALKGTK